ncbi:hypothetical protein O6H91_20G018400 [Diphasiastrum complanatum]|uniref:Uncharacterized protein n=1 Tax=Diphasiastrum complanatum TaxID=34168 RepID=A0ACC2AN90_DIPCM|nr:hypothetical protein O6H91_20G018400 [Diphasiastrum complanatum]
MDQKKRKLEENGVNEVEKEDVKRLMDILNQEQLYEILQNAAVLHEDVLDEIRKHVDKDPVHRKIFVRGLGWDTTTETVKNMFSQHGEVDEAIVIKDKATGKSRGFGFVTFRHMDGALRALKDPSKKIDGRMTVCQLASSGPSAAPVQQEDLSTRKIFIGNVPQDFPSDRLLSFFSQFGEIAEGPLGYDKATGKSRGFALIIFKSSEAAQSALQEPMKLIDGHQVVCKVATDGQHQKQVTMAGLQEGADPGKLLGFGSQYGAAAIQGGSNVQYGQVNRNSMMPGLPMNQALNGNPNQNVHPALHAGLMNQNQGYGSADGNPNAHQLTSSLNPPLNPHLNFPLGSQHAQANPQHGAGQALQPQASTRAGVPAYAVQGGGGAYNSQLPVSGQPANYHSSSATSFYGMAASSVPLQTAGVPLQQGAGSSYLMGSYPNAQQLPVSSAPRAQIAGQLPNMPSYY